MLIEEVFGIGFEFSEGDVVYMWCVLQLVEYVCDVEDEVLVGVVLVFDGEIVGLGWNCNIMLYDFIVYVEIMVMCVVGEKLVNYWMLGVMFYVMLELCVMCVMVLVYVCIGWVVYVVIDFKIGVVGSVFDMFIDLWYNYCIIVQGGLLVDELVQLLCNFFCVWC